MIESLNTIDTEIFLLLNKLNSPFWDQVMWYITSIKLWIPLYILILFFIFKRYKLKGFFVLIFLVLLVTLADQSSVKLFKEVFQRLRPCHNPNLDGLVHTVNGKCGGKFGFVSSHATNTFAFAMFISLFFKQQWITISFFIWAIVVSYSRIYLGVHYPGDVLGGAVLGIGCGLIVYYLYYHVNKRYIKNEVYFTN